MKKSQLARMVCILGMVLLVIGVVSLPHEGKKYLSWGAFVVYVGFVLTIFGTIAYRRLLLKEKKEQVKKK